MQLDMQQTSSVSEMWGTRLFASSLLDHRKGFQAFAIIMGLETMKKKAATPGELI